ncbi:hypothetical protein [Kitasatospora sp. NPDC057198]|uniref:hypothetical protein n=1 Tax=Kitasatospora sp. NPDC057198 TaxID=3346046 RepID=UPI0036418B59
MTTKHGTALLLPVAAALLLAGCSATPPRAAAPRPAPAATTAAALYASCMRLNGVPRFPDPDVYGGYRLGPATGVDPRTPEYRSAYTACEHLA